MALVSRRSLSNSKALGLPSWSLQPFKPLVSFLDQLVKGNRNGLRPIAELTRFD